MPTAPAFGTAAFCMHCSDKVADGTLHSQRKDSCGVPDQFRQLGLTAQCRVHVWVAGGGVGREEGGGKETEPWVTD